MPSCVYLPSLKGPEKKPPSKPILEKKAWSLSFANISLIFGSEYLSSGTIWFNLIKFFFNLIDPSCSTTGLIRWHQSDLDGCMCPLLNSLPMVSNTFFSKACCMITAPLVIRTPLGVSIVQSYDLHTAPQKGFSFNSSNPNLLFSLGLDILLNLFSLMLFLIHSLPNSTASSLLTGNKLQISSYWHFSYANLSLTIWFM